MIDIQKEKTQIANCIHTLLADLHKEFPWIVVELAISFQDKIGADNPLVVNSFKNVLDDLSREVLEKYLPECHPDEVITSEISSAIFDSFSVKDNSQINAALAKPVFSLDVEQADECLPWDHVEKNTVPTFDISGNANIAKLNLIQKIKVELRDLAFRQAVALKEEESFKDELEAISIIFENLDFLN